MDTRKVKRLYYMLINAKSTATFNLKKMRNKSFSYLANNRRFKGMHKNQRCFILGNGPSLKEEDLSQLGNEIVFTVNQASRNPQFGMLKSNYHFWADPNFFKISKENPEDIELLNTMMSAADFNHDMQCFFPIQQMDFVHDFGIDKKLNVNYFYTGLYMYDGFSKEIDFAKCVAGFGTVVQWCITMAIYMGFKEIYLLGCDNTSIITTVKSVLHKNDDSDYAYNVSENEKKRMEKMLANSSLEAYLQSYLRTLQDYRRLYDYCRERGIELVNCSAETVIDSIPKMRLIDVLKRE